MSSYLCCCIVEHLLPSISSEILRNEKYNEVEDQNNDDLSFVHDEESLPAEYYRVPIDIENCSSKNKHPLRSSQSYREAVRGNVADILTPLENSRSR